MFLGTVCNNELSGFLIGVTWSDRWGKKRQPERIDDPFWRIAGVYVCCSRYGDVGEWEMPADLYQGISRA